MPSGTDEEDLPVWIGVVWLCDTPIAATVGRLGLSSDSSRGWILGEERPLIGRKYAAWVGPARCLLCRLSKLTAASNWGWR